MGSAALNYELGSRSSLRLEGGYRYLYASQMNLTDNYNGTLAGAALKDSTNSVVPVDASSLFVGLSAMVAL